jgi:hypothetical protein
MFAAEVGFPHLRFLVAGHARGADIIAFDETAGRVAVVVVADAVTPELLGRTLAAAADVASWDAGRLAEVSDALQAVVPGDSPRLVLLAGGYDPRALATVDWLSRRHGVEVSAFSVSVLRFGAERLLSVVREPREHAGDPAADLGWMLTGGQAPEAAPADAHAAVSSTPPPGVPAF